MESKINSSHSGWLSPRIQICCKRVMQISQRGLKDLFSRKKFHQKVPHSVANGQWNKSWGWALPPFINEGTISFSMTQFAHPNLKVQPTLLCTPDPYIWHFPAISFVFLRRHFKVQNRSPWYYSQRESLSRVPTLENETTLIQGAIQKTLSHHFLTHCLKPQWLPTAFRVKKRVCNMAYRLLIPSWPNPMPCSSLSHALLHHTGPILDP